MVSRFQLTTEFIFGAGSIATLSGEAAKLGPKSMVVTYPDIRRIGLLDKVVKDLQAKNIEVVVFDKVQCNPRTTTVDEGAAFARLEKPDFFIGLGGGSVMDTAKGIAVTCTGALLSGIIRSTVPRRIARFVPSSRCPPLPAPVPR